MAVLGFCTLGTLETKRWLSAEEDSVRSSRASKRTLSRNYCDERKNIP